MGARAWPCPGPLWGGQGPAKEGGGRDRWSHSSWGWGKPELALAGPPGGLGRGSCPELSVQGGGREAATRSTPCASPWGRAAQPAGSIQSPPRGMLGEAARIRAAGCALPSPGNRGLKWVKEEGGGPGGRGRGPRRSEGTQREGARGGRLEKQNHVCRGPWGPGLSSAGAAEGFGVLEITSELTPGALGPGSRPRVRSFFLPLRDLGCSGFPQPLSLLRSPTPHPPPAKGSARGTVGQPRPLAQTQRWAPLGPAVQLGGAV